MFDTDGGRTDTHTHLLTFAVQRIPVDATVDDIVQRVLALDRIRDDRLDDMAGDAGVAAGETDVQRRLEVFAVVLVEAQRLLGQAEERSEDGSGWT